MVTIGWDISTAAIGICIKRDEQAHEFHVIFPKGDTPLDKWRSASAQVNSFVEENIDNDHYDTVLHVVEQRLGGFTGGLTTKQTLMALAAMNAVVSTVLSLSGKIMYILPVSAKAILKFKDLTLEGEDKKETVVRLARSACPGFPYKEKKSKGIAKGKVYPWVAGTDDMADAWMLLEAGTKVLKGEASIGQPKKAPGGKGKARRAKGDGDSQGGVRVQVPRKARKQRVPKRKDGEGEALGKSGE